MNPRFFILPKPNIYKLLCLEASLEPLHDHPHLPKNMRPYSKLRG
ncbi:hypothetical protein SOVF_181130 [Spinacia oleracea]|nr:hypothetical protein SOVF_181130 [Spinacia oleracea]